MPPAVPCAAPPFTKLRVLQEVSTQRWLQVITTFIGTLLVGTFLTQVSSPLLRLLAAVGPHATFFVTLL